MTPRKTPEENSNGTTALWWAEIVKSLGVPTVFLGVLIYMIWGAGTWLGTTVVVPMYSKQVAMIDEVSNLVRTMEDNIEGINRTLLAFQEHSIETLRVANQTSQDAASNGVKIDELARTNVKLIELLEKIEKNTAKP